MRRVRPLTQVTATECGLCCAAMVLAHYGSKESIVSLRQDFEVGRDGMSIRDLRELFESRGFEVRVFRANRAGLEDVALPVVALWQDSHFVVVERVRENGVTLLDPALGRVDLAPEEFDEGFTGIVVVPVPGNDYNPEARRDPWVWRAFLGHLREAKGALVVLTVLSVLIYLVSLTVPYITQKAIDGFVTAGAVDLRSLTVLLTAVAAIALFGVAQGQVFALTRLTVFFGRRLMTTAFGHLLRLPYKYYAQRGTGELIYRLNSIGGLRDLLAGQIVSGVLDAGMIIVVFIYMASRSLTLSLVALLFFAVILAVLLVTRRRILNALNVEMTEFSKTQGLQIEAVSSIASLRVAGVEEHFFRDWEVIYERGLSRMYQRSILQGWVSSFVTVMRTAAPLVLLVLALGMVGRGQLTLGEAVAFQAISTSFFGLTSSIYGSFSQYLIATSYLERLSDISRAQVEEWPDDGYTGQLEGRIDVEDVWFRFTRNGKDVLRGLSFAVPAGSKIAIVGRSGSGKTTLGQILAGLYRPTAGVVRYDGRTLSSLDRTAFFAQVGVVPQEIDLQNKSIKENIAMGSTVDDQRLVEATRAAQIHDEICRMPMAYDTQVSEMGGNISGGQRQRIALARAIYKVPRILILDEATSSLDVLNETKIAARLHELRCTRVVIAHRMSTVIDADAILVMHDGEIVQRGTHEDLIAVEGHYRDLFHSQRDAAILLRKQPPPPSAPLRRKVPADAANI
jgi:ABC-type bacteriocin/lantibiotic exporter with double-glycine peptidase domain